MVDMIVSRLDMKSTLSRVFRLLLNMPAYDAPVVEESEEINAEEQENNDQNIDEQADKPIETSDS